MKYYPSKISNWRYGIEFLPEIWTGRALVNPHYPARIKSGRVICDSGAFQDDGSSAKRMRVTPQEALDRQLRLQEYIRKVAGPDWAFEAVVHYDQMFGVDETLINGKKVKKRGTVETARVAIQATLEAAEYYDRQRHLIDGGVIAFSCQGINPRQYFHECALPLLEIMRPTDWFAFGGFCIIGKVPSLKPLFYETLDLVLPAVKAKGIKHVHLLGVTVIDCVQIANGIIKSHGLIPSNDSSTPEVNGIKGWILNEETGKYKKTYYPEDKGKYHPGQLAIDNVIKYNNWCSRLDSNSGAHALYSKYASQRRMSVSSEMYNSL